MKKYSLYCSIFTIFAALSQPAAAGDCNKVAFEFTNSTGSAIIIKSIYIDGNDGSWTEIIKNLKIYDGDTKATQKRRLNKLHSGQRAIWGVSYDWLKAETNSWVPVTRASRSYRVCHDDTTMPFELTSTKSLPN